MIGSDGGCNSLPGPGCEDAAFRYDAGPYLLGALDHHEHDEFETHQRGCAACRDAVAALRPVVAMLDALSGDDVARPLAVVRDAAEVPVTGPDANRPADRGTGGSPVGIPDTMLADLLARAAIARRRHGLLLTLSAVAAAAVIALVAVLAGATTMSRAPQSAAGQVVVMEPVGTVVVRATATVTGKPWGTEITLHCGYPPSLAGSREGPYARGAVFSLRVIDLAGSAQDLGSWSLNRDQEAVFVGGTSLSPDGIGRIEVLSSDGTAVLTAKG